MKKFLALTFLIVLFSCSSSDCSTIPSSFKSFSEAESIVNNASFSFTDDIETSESSWINGAKFYSCDKQTGFFILETDKANYIHQNMPINVWKDFKNAQSFGSYYNKFIKHRYQLSLAQ